MESKKTQPEQVKLEFSLDIPRLENKISTSQPVMSEKYQECRDQQLVKMSEYLGQATQQFVLKHFVRTEIDAIHNIKTEIKVAKSFLEEFFIAYENNQNTQESNNNLLALLLAIPQKRNLMHDITDYYVRENPKVWNKNYELTNHELAKLTLDLYLALKEITSKIEHATEYFDELDKSAKNLAVNFYQTNPNAHRKPGLEKLVKDFFYGEWGLKNSTDNIITLNAPKYEQDCFTDLNISNSKVFYFSDKGLNKILSDRLSRFLEFSAVSSLTALAGYKVFELSDIWTDQAAICLIAFCIETIAGKELFRGNEVYFYHRKRFVKNVAMLHLLLSHNKKMESHPAYRIIQSINPAKPKT